MIVLWVRRVYAATSLTKECCGQLVQETSGGTYLVPTVSEKRLHVNEE
jgi:hypothetical protein